MATILCIDEEPSTKAVVEEVLGGIGHTALLASSVQEGTRIIDRETVHLVLCEYRMRGQTGFDLLSWLRDRGLDHPVIIMTAYTSIEHAVLSMKQGAVDYLTKPLRVEAVRLAVQNALELDRLRRENRDIRREIETLRGSRVIIGQSRALKSVMEKIEAVAPTAATVLLEGESGTGKELFARAVHQLSPRAEGPFVTVNCAALPEGLVESTMFGHERGAFTGANARARGAFERAHRGTLLLDEISEMRIDLQPKLLRAIQEHEFTRVGGSEPIHADVRILATTNRDLMSEVEAGRFRRDLFYRIHVMPIRTPPLRDRIDDLPLLVDHFVQQCSQQLGVRAPAVSSEALECLRARLWPGNVRELANVVERAMILNRRETLLPEDFMIADAVRGDEPTSHARLTAPLATRDTALPIDLRVLEKDAIRRALEATGNKRARAAELLGISERTLRNKLKVSTH